MDSRYVSTDFLSPTLMIFVLTQTTRGGGRGGGLGNATASQNWGRLALLRPQSNFLPFPSFSFRPI